LAGAALTLACIFGGTEAFSAPASFAPSLGLARLGVKRSICVGAVATSNHAGGEERLLGSRQSPLSTSDLQHTHTYKIRAQGRPCFTRIRAAGIRGCCSGCSHHPGGNPWANLKSISHRCYLEEVAFVWELTEETIVLPLGCLQGGVRFHSERIPSAQSQQSR